MVVEGVHSDHTLASCRERAAENSTRDFTGEFSLKHLMKILKKTLANPRLVQHYKINVVHSPQSKEEEAGDHLN